MNPATRLISGFGSCLSIVLVLVFTSSNVHADQKDDEFEELLFNLCTNFLTLPAEGWTPESLQELNDLCLNKLPGGFVTSSTYQSSSNLGAQGAQSNSAEVTADAQVSNIKDRLAELVEEVSPETGWGLLIAVQKGETDRIDTLNETGYESELEGIVTGVDYRFSDALVVGIAAGYTRDEALFDNNTGFLNTSSHSTTLYFTVVPVEGAYIDGYTGHASLEFSNSREISFEGTTASPGSFTGTATGSFLGRQEMAGMSAGYDWYIGRFSVGPYVGVDYSKTTTDAYDETGDTGLEFSYDKTTTRSKLSSIGLNLGYNFYFNWGAIVPTYSIAKVHESLNDSRTFLVQPDFVPDGITTPLSETTIELSTDDPDRDFNIATVGITAALTNGTQFFLSYEQIAGDDLAETWAMTAGMLAEF